MTLTDASLLDSVWFLAVCQTGFHAGEEWESDCFDVKASDMNELWSEVVGNLVEKYLSGVLKAES